MFCFLVKVLYKSVAPPRARELKRLCCDYDAESEPLPGPGGRAELWSRGGDEPLRLLLMSAGVKSPARRISARRAGACVVSLKFGRRLSLIPYDVAQERDAPFSAFFVLDAFGREAVDYSDDSAALRAFGDEHL